ncbi:unnamed protein product [Rotaria sordida]|uniref:Transposase n=1 Tax=Rotaria sordida TaxID=392033 RepID=A0A815LRW6_9BILA|nr:unnamed protein product [Rotaria sordida]CAF1627479.1 unnamed protein product [Rotaria sordida]
MDKEYFRFYIKVLTALHIEPIAIHNELHTVFGDEAPPFRTVQRWSKWFHDGREEVEDQERSGRPITETTCENIKQVRDLIDDDPYVTVDELEAQSGPSHGTVQRIISDHLQLKKVTAGDWRLCDVVTGDESWFYHKQIGRKSSNAAWVARGDPSSTVVRRSHFAPKTLPCIFFKSAGPVLIHSFKRGQTIDHQYYINNCLRPVIDEIRKQRLFLGIQSIKLHHDNGRSHMHEDVVNYLQSEGVTIMQHAPNSPGLAPCDFWLFNLIKQDLDHQDDSESLHGAVIKFMLSLRKEEYKKTFDKWIQRMHLCINNWGDYFKHLM